MIGTSGIPLILCNGKQLQLASSTMFRTQTHFLGFETESLSLSRAKEELLMAYILLSKCRPISVLTKW